MSRPAAHHAYVLYGEREAALAAAEKFLEDELGSPVSGNPDVAVFSFSSLGVGESRAVAEAAGLRPLLGKSRALLIAADFLTREAQNALLKVLEEPPAGALILLVVPSPEHLLPTVRSRLDELPHRGGLRGISETARGFLRSREERAAIVADIAEERDKSRALALLAELERALRRQGVAKNRAALEAIVRARAYLPDPGASVKLLLEDVATVAPLLRLSVAKPRGEVYPRGGRF